MIYKTPGIVLGQHKYSDSKRIVNIFTKSAGKKSFIVYNSSKKRSKINYYQLLFVLNLEFYQKSNKNLLNLKEVSIYKPFVSIPFSPIKTSLIFFIAEILNKIIVDDFVDEPFFDFILNSLFVLDQHKKPANYHIAFLSSMSIYLGIMPEINFSGKNCFFNIKEGDFSDIFIKEYTMNKSTSYKFKQILDAGMENFGKVELNHAERKLLLAKIIDFYSYHFPSVKNIKSVKVLNEIFK